MWYYEQYMWEVSKAASQDKENKDMNYRGKQMCTQTKQESPTGWGKGMGLKKASQFLGSKPEQS